MCFLRFEGAGVLSSQARGEHDCSGKKHRSAVPTDGVPERMAGASDRFFPGARPARRGTGRRAEGGDQRLNSPMEWESTWMNVGGVMCEQGRGGGQIRTWGCLHPAGEWGDCRTRHPERFRPMVVPSVKRRSRGLVRSLGAWIPLKWVKVCSWAQSFKSRGNLLSRPWVMPEACQAFSVTVGVGSEPWMTCSARPQRALLRVTFESMPRRARTVRSRPLRSRRPSEAPPRIRCS